MECNSRGEQLFKVVLVGEVDKVFYLVCFIEDLDSMVELYKHLLGRAEASCVIVHESWDQELVDRLER